MSTPKKSSDALGTNRPPVGMYAGNALEGAIVNRKRFDAYEVRRVFEKDGICEPVDSEEEAKYYRQSGHDEYWTLYGHRDGEGVDAIADRKTEEEAHELLYAITGMTGEHGRDVYEVEVEGGKFEGRELATILHALRVLQEVRGQVSGGCLEGEEYGTDGTCCDHYDDCEPLTDAEIDALCERINY